jgi:hypothetical protein
MNDAARDEGPLVVAHHHPGRLRVRSRTFEWDDARREATLRWLAGHHGVRSVSAHAPTGSFLVLYDRAATDAGALLAAIAAHARLDIAERPLRAAPAQTIFDAARALDEQLLESSSGRFGLGVIVPMALGIGSLGSLVWSAHQRAPRWDNLLYWAVQFFWALNEDQPSHRRRHANAE